MQDFTFRIDQIVESRFFLKTFFLFLVGKIESVTKKYLE